MAFFEKFVYFIARWLNWLAAIAVVAVMTIVCVNVLARSLLSMPLKGTVDIVSQLGVIIIACAVAYTQVLKGHIRITLLVDRLPRLSRIIITGLVDLTGIFLFGVMSWQTLLFAKRTSDVGELSEVLKIPLTPFALIVSAGCTALTLVLLLDLIKVISKGTDK